MSHGRHDFPTAIHLLRVQGRPGYSIFFSAEILRKYPEDAREHAPDVQFWESLVARVCDRQAAIVHGYVWLPNAAILLLQRFAIPLRIILPSLLGRYSRYLHKKGRVPPGVSPYLCRCESMEITPDLLPYALRNLYARPIRAGLSESPLKYPFCSSSLHFAESTPGWFETKEFIGRVRTRGHIGRASVEQFLAKSEGRRHAELFERISARTPQIAGELADIDESIRLANCSPPAPSVEQVAEAVSRILRGKLLAPGTVLAAALITWYATRTGAATLAQMGHWFDREPTTLRADIESHRKRSAALFELTPDEFHTLIRALGPATTALHVSARPDVPDVVRTPITPSSRVPMPKNVPIQGREGPSGVPSSAELGAACMISNEDTDCHEAQSNSEFSAARQRRTQK